MRRRFLRQRSVPSLDKVAKLKRLALRRKCGAAAVRTSGRPESEQNKNKTRSCSASRVLAHLDWPGSPRCHRYDALGAAQRCDRESQRCSARCSADEKLDLRGGRHCFCGSDWSLSVSRSGCTRDGARDSGLSLVRWNAGTPSRNARVWAGYSRARRKGRCRGSSVYGGSWHATRSLTLYGKPSKLGTCAVGDRR